MSKRFKKVYIEITNICNLSCEFCPKTTRHKEMMTTEQFEHIINQVKPYTDYVYFHIMGEPLLHPQISEFFDICERERLKVNLTTNGTLIQKNTDMLLRAKSLRQVNLSLHSYEANSREKELTEYINQILDFIITATTNTNVFCSMRLWNMDSSDLQGANELNYHIIQLIEKRLSLTDSIMEKLIETKQLKLSNQVYLNMAERFEWPNITLDDTNHKIFCYGLRNQIGFLVDGTVVPCCLDSEGTIALGNINKESLEDILQGERAKALFHGFSNRQAIEALCRRCGYAKRF